MLPGLHNHIGELSREEYNEKIAEAIEKINQQPCISFDESLSLYKIKIYIPPLSENIEKQDVKIMSKKIKSAKGLETDQNTNDFQCPGLIVSKKLAFENDKYLRRRAQIEQELCDLRL